MSTNNPVFVSPIHASKEDLEMINGERVTHTTTMGDDRLYFTKDKIYTRNSNTPILDLGKASPTSKNSGVRVFGDKVLIKPDAVLENYKNSNIILPEVTLEKPLTGEVIAIGSKVEEVRVGDRVRFGKFAGYEIDDLEIDGVKELLILCSEGDILFAV